MGGALSSSALLCLIGLQHAIEKQELTNILHFCLIQDSKKSKKNIQQKQFFSNIQKVLQNR